MTRTDTARTAGAARVASWGRGSPRVLGVFSLVVIGLLAAGCRSTQSDPNRPGLRVRPGVAFEMAADAQGMPILDLRKPDEFDGPLGHLRRAYNLPLEELPRRLPEIRWLRERTFLIYCRGSIESGEGEISAGAEAGEPGEAGEVGEAGGGTDGCGEEAIRLFLAQGFDDAVLLEGGIRAWLEDGFATVHSTGETDMALPEDPGLRVSEDSKSIGDPRHLPEPP